MRLPYTPADTQHHRAQTPRHGAIALAAVAACLLTPLMAHAAGSGSAPPGAGEAVRFEPIPGSSVKRVILSPKAVERLGIETAEIREERVARTQMFGGTVVHPARVEQIQLAQAEASSGFAIFGQPSLASAERSPASHMVTPASDETWVRVALSQAEWERVAQDQPARLLPLDTRDDLPDEVTAQLSPLPPIADLKRSMLTLFYVVSEQPSGLRINDRLRIELRLKGDNEMHKVMPYSAIYYDDMGEPWVYVRTAPLTYERQRVKIGRIDGDMATLEAGPPVGTQVVSVGAPLLYGAEVIYKY